MQRQKLSIKKGKLEKKKKRKFQNQKISEIQNSLGGLKGDKKKGKSQKISTDQQKLFKPEEQKGKILAGGGGGGTSLQENIKRFTFKLLESQKNVKRGKRMAENFPDFVKEINSKGSENPRQVKFKENYTSIHYNKFAGNQGFFFKF